MGFFALSTLLVAGAGVYLLSRVMPNFQINNKRIQADLKEMREELEPLTNHLIPISDKELELIARQIEPISSKKRFTQNRKGKVETIFDEEVAIYYHRIYNSNANSRNELLYVQMDKYQYYYWLRKEEIRFVIDNQYVGSFKGDNLYGGKNQELIARLDRTPKNYDAIIVRDREVASLSTKAKEQDKKDLTNRAFEFIVNDLSSEERHLIVAFTLLELIIH
ncbi:MAG: hypothetical protein AAFO07_32010 [Bacteroidota bacterium]